MTDEKRTNFSNYNLLFEDDEKKILNNNNNNNFFDFNKFNITKIKDEKISHNLNNINEYLNFCNIPEKIINKNDYKFLLFVLIKSLFKNFPEEKIKNDLIEKNYQFPKEINFDFSLKNYENIVNFTKNKTSENIFIYVLEHLLLVAFSLISSLSEDFTLTIFIFDDFYKISKENIYYDLRKIIKNYYLNDSIVNSFENEKKLFEKEKNNFENIKKNKNLIKNIFNEIQPLIYFLKLIHNKKLEQIQTIKNEMNQIKIFNEIKNENQNDFLNSIKNLQNLTEIDLIKFFIYKIFITYSIKNSILMNLNQKKSPFEYDLQEANIKQSNSIQAITPIMTENRIKTLLFNSNNFGEIGFFELGKMLILNSNIENIFLNQNNINCFCLFFFFKSIGINKIKNIKFLDLMKNKINNFCEDELIKIIDVFPNLKTLILNKNELKNSLRKFFCKMNVEYKLKKCKIKTLLLISVDLSIKSILILAELIKNKFCLIENLNLNNNNLNNFAGEIFLKNVQKNKNLTELYLYNCNLSDKNFESLSNIIKFSNVNWLYLYKNKINNYENILKLIANTNLIGIDKKNSKNSVFNNLDISQNYPNFLNEEDKEILADLIKKTSLDMLDINCNNSNGESIYKKDDDNNNNENNFYKIMENEFYYKRVLY